MVLLEGFEYRPTFATVRPVQGSAFGGIAIFALGACVLVSARTAHAQNQDEEINVQRFSPAAGPRNLIVTRGARTAGEMAYSAGLTLGYSHEPFKVQSCANGTTACSDSQLRDVHPVKSLFSADFLGSLSPGERWQLGLRVPLYFSRGDGLAPGGQPDPGGKISALGFGDAEFEIKLRAFGEIIDSEVVGAAAVVTLPLGASKVGGKFVSDDRAAFGLRAIFDGDYGKWRLLGNLTPMFRKQTSVGNTRLGDELSYSAGVGYRAGDTSQLLVDAFGATRFNAGPGNNPLEVDAAWQLSLTGSLSLQIGGGASPLRGIGSPLFRAFLALRYVEELLDRDGDGVDDARDRCPLIAEDLDGTEDDDGCPDLNEDGDVVTGPKDQCPLEPEDADGFADDDGCPDPDNDQDGLFDGQDRCPNQVETVNGYQDSDGCPDKPDSDNDGLIDSQDKCPSEPEDTDGFEDDDGCVDPDNDGDGIVDGADECPEQKETINGRSDGDGCPD